MSHQIAMVVGVTYPENQPIVVEALARDIFTPVYTDNTTLVGVSPDVEQALALLQELRQEYTQLACVLHAGPVPPLVEYLINSTVQRCLYLLRAIQPNHVVLTAAALQQGPASFEAHGQLVELGRYRLPDLLPEEQFYELLESSTTVPVHLQSLEQYTHNLPVQASAFLGREKPLQKLTQLLQSDLRLITLEGPSGIGKTRLAIQAAARALAFFEAGVFFVACAPLKHAADVPTALAHVLGISETADEPLQQTLARQLEFQSLLLVLDNVEQIDEPGQVLDYLLEHTQQLKVLLTSQESLGIAEEYVFEVPPFRLPDPDKLPDLETFQFFPVIALFMNRAHEVQPALALDTQQARTLARICQLVEGLPLAVELIAAHTDRVTLDHMLEQLQERLAETAALATTRRRVINPVLQWSVEQLEASTQRLFARLSVFVGGFTIDDAEAVCYRYGQIVEDVTNELIVLLNHNLLLYEELAEGVARYTMLDCVHEFARELAQQFNEWAMIQERHLEYYRDVAERTEPLLRGENMVYWLQWLESQHHNLRAALNYGITIKRTDDVLRLASALGRFWLVRNHYREGTRWLEQVLALPDGTAELRSWAMTALGTLYLLQSSFDQAHELYSEALPLQRQAANPSREARILNNMGVLETMRGNYEQAVEWFEANVGLLRQHGNTAQVADALNNLGVAAHEQGDYDRAARYYTESFEIAQSAGDLNSVAISLVNLGEIDILRQQPETASSLLQEGRDMARKVGNLQVVSDAQVNLALLALERGDVEAAEQFIVDTLRIRLDQNELRGLAITLEALAAVQLQQTELSAAAQLLGAAEHLRQQRSIERSHIDTLRFQQLSESLQTQLGPDQWHAAWELGQQQEPTTLLQQLGYIV